MQKLFWWVGANPMVIGVVVTRYSATVRVTLRLAKMYVAVISVFIVFAFCFRAFWVCEVIVVCHDYESGCGERAGYPNILNLYRPSHRYSPVSWIWYVYNCIALSYTAASKKAAENLFKSPCLIVFLLHENFLGSQSSVFCTIVCYYTTNITPKEVVWGYYDITCIMGLSMTYLQNRLHFITILKYLHDQPRANILLS